MIAPFPSWGSLANADRGFLDILSVQAAASEKFLYKTPTRRQLERAIYLLKINVAFYRHLISMSENGIVIRNLPPLSKNRRGYWTDFTTSVRFLQVLSIKLERKRDEFFPTFLLGFSILCIAKAILIDRILLPEQTWHQKVSLNLVLGGLIGLFYPELKEEIHWYR